MAEPTPQSFDNHTRYVPFYHFVVVPLLGLNVLWTLWQVIRDVSTAAVVSFLIAICLLAMSYYLRAFPLTVQDRLIRLEESLRMHQVLPEELRGRVAELRRGQFVALRFAGDDELPELVRRVLDGELKTGAEIKKAIRDWRPDLLRC